MFSLLNKKQAYVALSLAAITIAGCSGTSNQATPSATQNQVSNQIPETIIEIEKINTLLKKADASLPPTSYSWLLQAADEYLKQGEIYKAYAIAKELQPLVAGNMDATQCNLILAEVLVAEKKYLSAYQLIDQLSLQLGFDKRIFALHSQLYQWNNEAIKAAEALSAEIEISSLSIEQKQQKMNLLWNYLSKLPLSELEQPLKSRREFKAWLNLASSIKKQAFKQTSISQLVANWQLNNPNHPASQQLPIELARLVEQNKEKPSNISVLLPASGNLKHHGEAVKNGILFNNWQQQTALNINFIDANLPEEEITELLHQQQPQLIIGPLSKTNLTRLAPVLQPYQTLALNKLAETSVNPKHFFLSLDTSREAIQAVDQLLDKGFKKPIVISQSSNTSKKVAETFSTLWQQQTEYVPEIVFFDNKANMQNTVRNILDVKASVSRDRAVRLLYKRSVKSELRSRKDIDVVYLIASVNQTRLLKPYIDVNVSAFTKSLPIYATSRSFSEKADRTILRDLNQLTFSDMPWLIETKENRNAKSNYKKLWPESTDTESRLFALGFDSLNIAPLLETFSYLPNTFFTGKSGNIYLSENNNLIVERIWAQYQKSSVKPLVAP